MSNTVLGDLDKVDNLNDPTPALNKKSVILGIVISFLTVSTLGAIGRLYIRARITRNLGLDDLFVSFSVIANLTAGTSLFMLTSNGGLGQHFMLLGVYGMQKFLKLFYVANAMYIMSTALIKLALLFQYLRMMERGTKLWTITVVFLVIVSLWGSVFSMLVWIPCVPVKAFWDWTIPQDTVSRYGFGSDNIDTLASTFFGHAASNMFLDMVTFSIPVPLWVRTSAEKRTRLALLGLFMLGAVVNVFSIMRLFTLVENRAATYPTFDPSWYGSSSIVLSALEVHFATICASLPVFWPIFKDVLSSRRILVTHEVVVKRETRKPEDFIGSSHELRSLSPGFGTRPWEHVGSEYQSMRRELSISHESSASAAPKQSHELLVVRCGTADSGTEKLV